MGVGGMPPPPAILLNSVSVSASLTLAMRPSDSLGKGVSGKAPHRSISCAA
jgi:hypothetical protein